MNLRCQDVLDRLVEAATGSGSSGDRAAVLEHLAACPRCRHEAASLEATVEHLQEAGKFVTPPGFWNAFMVRLHDQIAAEQTPAALRLRRWLASPRHAWGTAAASTAIVLLVSAVLRFTPARPTPSDPVRDEARGLVTTTMRQTLPSLGEMLDTWRAGLTPDVERASDRTGP
jgi:anti-sigma factor RsiW